MYFQESRELLLQFAGRYLWCFFFLNFNILINVHFAFWLKSPPQLGYFGSDPQVTINPQRLKKQHCFLKSHLHYWIRTGYFFSSINFPLSIQCECHQAKHDLSLLQQQVSTIPTFFSVSSKRNLLGLSSCWDRRPPPLSYFRRSAAAVKGIPVKHS